MDRFAGWLVRHPRTVLVAHVVVTLVLGTVALRLRIESTIESMLPANSPEVHYYAETRRTFGSDDVAVIGLRADGLFASATLEKIARVTDAVGAIDGVEQALSITNAVDPAADVFDPPRLLPHIPPTAAEITALKHKLTTIPLYGKNLVSDDLKGAAINIFFKPLSDAEYVDRGIDAQIEAILNRESGPEHFYYTGAAHLKQRAVALMRRDLFRFTPVALALVMVILWLSFRSVLGVLLPMIAMVMAVVWTLGAMVLVGKSITLGTFVLPPLLLVLGSEYAIHVVARYLQTTSKGLGAAEHNLRFLRLISVPVSVSALTMIVGFGSLMVNRITAIWDLGLFTVIGLSFLIVTSLGFLPAALQVFAFPSAGKWSTAPSGWLPPFLSRMGDRALTHRRAILWGSLGLSALALAGTNRIRVDSDFLTYFAPSSEVRQANEVINRTVVGSNPFALVIEGTEPGLLRRWEVLKQIKDLQDFLLTVPGITSSVSLVDYLEVLERGLIQNASGDIMIDAQGDIVEAPPKPFWEEPASLPPVLKLIDSSPATFKQVVTPDFARASVLVRTRLSGSREIEGVLARIRSYTAQHFPAQLKVHPTGNLVLLTGTTSDIVAGQVHSLALALGVIFVVMSAMFLSVRIGFLAMLPNIVPIVIFFGALGWFGIFLNMGTSLIAAISLGVAVDSAIHYLARLNLELKRSTDQAAAQSRTVETVGVPIVSATVALFFGFLTFAFSGFVPIQNFGILSSITMAAALVTNLVLLPALLAGVKIITLWDLVGTRLGEDPTRTIPLFAGLRPAQARIVVLMGRIRKFAAGQAIVRQHEVGTEMYVILRGTTQVWAGSGLERRRVVDLRRGDVFGEMALVRNIARSADVIAADSVEVLAVDERFIRRLQARYPRIAAKVFLNLTRILSDRLQRTTEQFVASR
jgi:uncharacterized protein